MERDKPVPSNKREGVSPFLTMHERQKAIIGREQAPFLQPSALEIHTL
jgi:hypothetical protein